MLYLGLEPRLEDGALMIPQRNGGRPKSGCFDYGQLRPLLHDFVPLEQNVLLGRI